MSTRERLVRETAALLERKGYQATGIKEIVRAAGATPSSLYHHFPGGKQELAVAALGHAGERFADLLRGALAREPDVDAAVAACATDLADDLAATDWADGCPVAVTALESVGDSPLLRTAAADILRGWRELIAARLRAGGIDADAAIDLACTVVSILEGAELQSRVTAGPGALHTAATHLSWLVRGAVRAESAPARSG
ncbi:TetR/AcrR family transcriptional regulator [Pseudonocardia acaciae]|uniref:TetR/AcrR family transcriptional regulator n=1 Tax=Pseudonocardia acaciae TaxID=551276 RepID=UPI00055DAF8A|nr:TetR/AcrR family transcriptional regulator [Pseudonocardia acaciae]